MSLPTKEERIRRKKVMQASGISVPNTDESWGPWWDQQWEKAITHTKDNNYYGTPSVWNLVHRTWDKVTDNTTYKAEPQPIGGTVQATDMSPIAQIKRTLNNWQLKRDPVLDVVLLSLPTSNKFTAVGNAIIEKTPQLIKTVSKLFTKEGAKKAATKATKFVAKETPKIGIGYLAGKEVDKASKAITGKSWAENASDKMSDMVGFNVEPIFGEFTNPGYYTGSPMVNLTTKGTKAAVINQNYSIPFLTNNKILEKEFGQMLKRFNLGTGNQNIRYRNGIRDYLGNVLDKYSTSTSKPVVFTGNQLELARQRVLNNLEKYGIRDTDYVSWTTSIDDPNLLQLSKSIGFEIPKYNKTPYSYLQVTVTMPAKTYLEHISPIPGIEASFRPSSATIFHQNDGYIEDIQKLYPEFVDAHEFSHAIDWVLHNKTRTIPQTRGVDIRLNAQSIKYPQGTKIDLTKHEDYVTVPGLNYNRIRQDMGTQEYHHSPTELKARYEQIRNWLGITDERPLTLTEWNQAKRYYTSSVGDNNMQEFFKLVEKPEEFINWASKRYATNYSSSVSRNAIITELPKYKTPIKGRYYYPWKVNHDDELPGFLDMIQEQARGKAPISQTSGLTSYAMPKPTYQLTPSERPEFFNGVSTVFRRQDPQTITAGDQAYGLAHNLTGWNKQTYKGILKDTGRLHFDHEEAARSLMYDVKAQLYKKLAAQKGGPLSAEEFEDALWDLTATDFQNAFKKAHGGMYRKDIPLTFDIEHLDPYEDIPRIINILTQYKNGGKFYR